MKKLYLDNAASTVVCKEVIDEMNKFFSEDYGNPSSLHELGERAGKAINIARKNLAGDIGAKANELYFTSGATEANNIALRCLDVKGKNKIIISAIEHPSIEETASHLEKNGYKVVRIEVNNKGFVNLDELERSIDEHTLLVSIIHANNVFGTIQDLKAIGKICKKKGVLFHTDAVQSFGKLKIDVKNLGIDLLSTSAHKIGGPKGIGFIYIKENVRVSPFIFGGEQERGVRAGTENVPGIIGFSKALEICKRTDKKRIEIVRDKLIKELGRIRGCKLTGAKGKERIYNNVNVCFPGMNAEILVYRLSNHGIYISSGSACDSKKKKDDLILKALGLNKRERAGSIRISLDGDINEKDIKRFIRELRGVLKYK